MTDFDPWSTDQATPQTTIGHRRFNTSLVDRARKRVPDVSRTSGRAFIVNGNDKFNDTYPNYEVTWHGGNNYSCSCYSLTHGDTRAKNSCSHVVAVMLYRESHGFVSDNVIADGGNGHTEPTLPFEEDGGKGNGGRAASVRSDLTVIVPSISDQRWTNWDSTPLPSKFQELRPHQWDAVNETLDCYERGVEVVWLDAPTGAGKSLVAELVRRLLQLRAFYLCHTISLQEQLARDFPYAKILKGRRNYLTLDGDRDVTCADCTMSSPDDDCMWCSEKDQCPYQRAKSAAIQAKLAVLNTSYFLTEFNWVGQVGKQRELGILDECDTLEGALMGFVEFHLGERMLSKVGVSAPKEGSHYTTLGKWLVEDFKPRLHEYQKTIRGDDLRVIRERMQCARLMADVLRIETQIEADETMANWVRDNRAGPFVLKPVTVGDYGDRYVWSHAKKWLCMSATIISPDELSDSCGLTGGQGEGQQGRRWEMVRVPMTFPVENRRVIVAPVADMSKKGKEAGEWEYAATALRNICDRHPNERILVHTVSYELARFLVDRVAPSLTRPLYTYSDSGSRDLTLAKFRRDRASVLVAASMDRGVDLAYDDCRVIVVAKIPFPNLGDTQISKRMRMPGGQSWYIVQAIRKLVQMTGRAVRSEDDSALTYILDRQMTSNILKKHRQLLPKWWLEALDTKFDIRELLKVKV